MAEIKLIHPKTERVRVIDEHDKVRLKILTRAGFVDAATHRPLPNKVLVPEPTLAEVLESQRDLSTEFPGVDVVAERAVHEKVAPPGKPEKETALVSRSAQALIDEKGLDLTLIVGTGKEGKIIKPDVVAYMESMEPKELEEPKVEAPAPAEVPAPATEEPTEGEDLGFMAEISPGEGKGTGSEDAEE